MSIEPAGADGSADAGRRALLRAAAGAVVGSLAGCASSIASPAPWESRLRGQALALLGEVHDNAQQHRLRTDVLARALAAGWRPTLVMEQFDLDRQDDVDRARRERPRVAAHVVAQAAGGGWHWPYYEPVIALALAHDLPLVAGNVPRAWTSKLVRDDYAAVLGDARVRAWGLDRRPDADWQAAQEREIDAGHCGALPPRLWPGMARGQFARDAALAYLLRTHGAQGAVLWAGNGHVRRDLGVPRWLERQGGPAALAVGFIERGTPKEIAAAYDAVVWTDPAARPDPCDAFRRAPQPGGIGSGTQRT
ncbi:MAG TPA: ChaN family lipoprotein [Burkholderiaceae bacterium]|nr:ChaN family lipoprotein [Burkholderiaceae bacterium]